MEPKLCFCGHSWKRRFFYKDGSAFREYNLPGGSAMLELLVTGNNLALLTDDYRYENLILSKDEKTNSLYVREHAGWTEGKCEVPLNYGLPAVIWDEGLSDLGAPENVPVLWISNRALPSYNVISRIKDNCVIMLDADVLRRKGAMISKQVSWEHSATDLVWQLKNNTAISYLSAAKHIIVTFAEEGAAYIRRGDTGVSYELVLADGSTEGTLRAKRLGEINDAWTAIAANIALQFLGVLNGTCEFSLSPSILAGASMIINGYERNALENSTFDAWIDKLEESVEDSSFAIPVYDGSEGADPNYWCIGSEASGRRIFDIAFDYVKNGPAAIKGLPQLSFGVFTTIDRREIESFQNVRNLILEYAHAKSVRPLSIVVFGAPGSGKSFGITQIAKNILPGLIEKLEFNVSQFAGSSDLSSAFHQVRDTILMGKLPLVFFDEFDSDREGRPLGWIKSFLMPMQDGKFKDENGEHPVGKCIMVFAGGTSQNFEDFCSPLRSDDCKRAKGFKDIKGPDFISRLRGVVNVMGPNQVSKDDRNFILRRALLLRSLLERKLSMKSGKAPINDNVLKAMLLAPNYRHGARSMESILDMSCIGGDSFEPTSLPFYTQLSLHVDPDAFINLVLNEVRLASFTEKLARAIHNEYVEKYKSSLSTGKYVIPWKSLPEEKRNSNRRQAQSISKKLSIIGCGYDAGDTPFESVKEFTEEEINVLARLEHDLWLTEMTAENWVYGEIRDDAKKIHNDLVPWERLSDQEKQKDYNTAKNIIPLLESVSLRVYRII
jgi:hypothetical protein